MNVMRSLKRKGRLSVFRLKNANKQKFECPVCRYKGPFEDINPPTGLRKHAQCPSCGALERHRLQFLVVENLFQSLNTSQMKMLHFAPEPFFKHYFSKRFGSYETADIEMEAVDHKVDLQNLPFADSSYDFVYASHVLEHIPEDKKAIGEIRRVLRPGGIAVLPVPLVSTSTIEYAEPNPEESYHVRAPGPDYFDRYTPYFSRVEKYASDSLPAKHQLFIYEDRTRSETLGSSPRPPMTGEKHADVVPVCYV